MSVPDRTGNDRPKSPTRPLGNRRSLPAIGLWWRPRPCAELLQLSTTGATTSPTAIMTSTSRRLQWIKLLDADNLDGEIVSTVGTGTSGGPMYRIDESGE